jgi:GNAT superfamily N-acetyltransferase
VGGDAGGRRDDGRRRRGGREADRRRRGPAGLAGRPYVIPEWWGTGAAGLLHDRALELLGPGGHRLWVLEENSGARRFYERRGWSENGETRVVPFPPHPLDVGYGITRS